MSMQCNFLCTIGITKSNIQNSFYSSSNNPMWLTLALIEFNFCETILLTYNFSNMHVKFKWIGDSLVIIATCHV